MKKTLLILTLFFAIHGTAQVNWIGIPETPVSPAAGSVTAEAGDMMITDDGNIYTAYMYDNGSGFSLYFQQYTQASGWTGIYSETVYDGAKLILSRKLGNNAYFITRTGSAAGEPLYKVYLVNSAGIDVLSSFQITNAQSDFDFEVAPSGNYGYIFYNSTSGNNVVLGRIEFSTNQLISQVSAVAGITSIDSYDMTIAGDSLFMLVSAVNISPKLYLWKSGPDVTGMLPYSASSADGELFNASQSITCHNPMINSDGNSKVFLLGYDQGNMAGVEKTYENGVLTDYAFTGSLAEYYTRGSTIGTADRIFYLNNYSPSNAAPYSTYVLTRDVNTGIYDTIATPGNYILATNQPTQHRLSLSAPNKRMGASFFDPASGTRKYLISNHVPYISATYGPDGICELQSSNIYNSLEFTDENGEAVTIVEIYSSDPSVLDPANIGYNWMGQNGNVSSYFVYGTAAQAGTVTLSFKVTDGLDTLIIDMPAITAIVPNPPTYTAGTLHLCSGQGEVNLFDYISATGGAFYINALEINFDQGIFDTDNSPLNAEDLQSLSYDLFDGHCNYTVNADIIYHNSPAVNITTTPTSCGLNTGSATALITGGATPYQLLQWSSGEQNLTNVSDLAAGQYSFLVIDANTCNITNYFEVGSTGTDATGIVTNVSCDEGSDGSITINTVGLTAPVSAFWSSGQASLNLAGVSAGNYTVTLTDANACSITKTFTITEPESMVTEYTIDLPTCGLSDGSAQVLQTTGGAAPYTYSWSNGNSGPLSGNLAFGIYSLTTTDNNGCMIVNTLYISEEGAADLYGDVAGTNCGAAEGYINVTPIIPMGSAVSYISWSNGAVTEDIADLLPDTYICTLELDNNCTAIKAWDIPVVEPLRNDICVVTVDSATTTNLVVWEKVQTEGIAYYNIYRETSVQGQYALIDTVHATNLSLFNDVVASPLSRSWRYKISAVNACDAEGPVSPAHQTIHLDVIDNGGVDVTVNWNAYEGAAFSNYIISRYTDANSWEVVATVPTTQLSYTDNVPFNTPGLDYMVEIELDETCTALIWRAQDFNSARSNKDKAQFSAGEGTGDSNNGLYETTENGNVTIYPNPFADELAIVVSEANTAITVEIYTVSGQLLHKSMYSNGTHSLSLPALQSGIYLIRTGLGGHPERFVKN